MRKIHLLGQCLELRDQESITESYVNLIPTIQGGTHVAGGELE